MRVDALSVELRPRPAWEAADLGIRLVQVHAASVWRTFGPLYLVLVLACMSTVFVASWLPGLLIFWLKPWMDRSLLFILSRALFGQPTRFHDLWQAQRTVWWGGLLRTLLLRRLSPWRSFTQPIEQLEGQTGKARRQRRKLLLVGQRKYARGLMIIFAHIELIWVLGLFLLAMMFAPEATRSDIFLWFTQPATGSVLPHLVQTLAYASVVLVLEPLFVGAGFALYLNRRVQLECWDIEQEFRRAFG